MRHPFPPGDFFVADRFCAMLALLQCGRFGVTAAPLCHDTPPGEPLSILAIAAQSLVD